MTPTDAEHGQFVNGWAGIARFIHARVAVPVSLDSCQRWSRQAIDPLPVARWGRGKVLRVVADARELDSWIDRQWHRKGDSDRTRQTQQGERRALGEKG